MVVAVAQRARGLAYQPMFHGSSDLACCASPCPSAGRPRGAGRWPACGAALQACRRRPQWSWGCSAGRCFTLEVSWGSSIHSPWVCLQQQETLHTPIRATSLPAPSPTHRRHYHPPTHPPRRRVYNQCLLVMDDCEFHERQTPFNLGQQRAIAAALNTLVFRTQLPEVRDASGGGGGSGGKPAAAVAGARGKGGGAAAFQMLQAAAPLLHRALYDRDARRQFCPLALWLEPYHHHLAANAATGSAPGSAPQQQQQQVSGAAVVRALLAVSDDGAEEGSPRGPPGLPPVVAAAAATAAASRPAAVAAILTAAPQCVPFEERLSVFRALIDMDKERYTDWIPPRGGVAPATVRCFACAKLARRQCHWLDGMGVVAQPAGRPTLLPVAVTQPRTLPRPSRPLAPIIQIIHNVANHPTRRCGYHLAPIEGGPRPLPITIRRGYVLEDAAAQASCGCAPEEYKQRSLLPLPLPLLRLPWLPGRLRPLTHMPCCLCLYCWRLPTWQVTLLHPALLRPSAAGPHGECSQVAPQHHLHQPAGPAGELGGLYVRVSEAVPGWHCRGMCRSCNTHGTHASSALIPTHGPTQVLRTAFLASILTLTTGGRD